MALCSVSDVRVYFSPDSLTDDDITSIIAQISDEIATEYNVSASSTDNILKLACIHSSVATTMRKAKLTGELAQSVKSGNFTQQLNVDQDIEIHESKASRLLMRFSMPSLGLIYGRTGVHGVNHELDEV